MNVKKLAGLITGTISYLLIGISACVPFVREVALSFGGEGIVDETYSFIKVTNLEDKKVIVYIAMLILAALGGLLYYKGRNVIALILGIILSFPSSALFWLYLQVKMQRSGAVAVDLLYGGTLYLLGMAGLIVAAVLLKKNKQLEVDSSSGYFVDLSNVYNNSSNNEDNNT